MSEKVLAIVVTYNPDQGLLSSAIAAIEGQGCDVLVVDNGSSDLTGLQSTVAGLNGSTLVALKQNLGLGAAHNIGIKHARDGGYEYVLIMDQDSVPIDGMVTNLLGAHQTKSLVSKVSAVGVTYLNADNGSRSFFVRFGSLKFRRVYCSDKDSDSCIDADFLISSGSLISLKSINDIGDMDESLFIDHVDTEWFLRAKSKGFKAYGVCNALMEHGLGEKTHAVSFAGRQRNVPQHKPFRYYYIFRNSLILYKRGYTSWQWKWNDVQRLTMIAIMFGLLTSPRKANLGMMFKGIWHGLLGKQGPLDDKPALKAEAHCD